MFWNGGTTGYDSGNSSAALFSMAWIFGKDGMCGSVYIHGYRTIGEKILHDQEPDCGYGRTNKVPEYNL